MPTCSNNICVCRQKSTTAPKVNLITNPGFDTGISGGWGSGGNMAAWVGNADADACPGSGSDHRT